MSALPAVAQADLGPLLGGKEGRNADKMSALRAVAQADPGPLLGGK